MSNFRDEEYVRYSWNKGDCANTLSVERGESLGVPGPGSEGEFIIEHYWGYTKRGENRTDEYKVEHRKWEMFAAKKARIDVDFATTYGEEFGFLAHTEPHSVLLAKGSDVAVNKGESTI